MNCLHLDCGGVRGYNITSLIRLIKIHPLDFAAIVETSIRGLKMNIIINKIGIVNYIKVSKVLC